MNYISLLEAFDKTLPVHRDIPSLPYIADNWTFEMGSTTHVVRFEHGDRFGPRAMEIKFGVQKGRGISAKLRGITDVRMYIATVMKAIDQALEDPTKKMKRRNHGFVLVINSKIYEQYAFRIRNILRRRYRGMYDVVDGLEDFPFGNMNAVYMVKKGKTFGSVFPEVIDDLYPSAAEPEQDDIEDFAPEPELVSASPDTESPIQSSVVDEPDEVGAEPEYDEEPSGQKPGMAPGDSTEVVDDEEEDFPLRFKTRKKIMEYDVTPYEEMFTIQEAKEAFYRVAYSTTMERPTFGESTRKKKIDITTRDIEGALYYKRETGTRSLDISEKKLAFVLDSYGHSTPSLYSDWGKSYFSNDVGRELFQNTKTPKQVFPPMKTLSWSKVYDILQNFDHEYAQAVERLAPNRTPPEPKYSSNMRISTIGDYYSKMSKDELMEVMFRFLHGLRGDLPNEDLFKYQETGEGKHEKTKKTTKSYIDLSEEFENTPSRDVLSMTESMVEKLESPEEVMNFHRSIPNWAHDNQMRMISQDYEMFETTLIDMWLMMGGSESYSVSGIGAKNVYINSSMPEEYLWEHNEGEAGRFSSYEVKKGVYSMPHITQHFEKMWQKTQEFYRQKLKKKYQGYKFKLYRGVGLDSVSGYVPAPMESWSKQKSTGKRFAKMMSMGGTGTIMYAEVPVEYIIASYESMSEVWESEDNLKGKAEFIVMGGAFNHVPIYEYIPEVKYVDTDRPLSFAEHYMRESSQSEGDQIKIVSKKDAKKKPNEIARGVEPNEDLTKGPPEEGEEE